MTVVTRNQAMELLGVSSKMISSFTKNLKVKGFLRKGCPLYELNELKAEHRKLFAIPTAPPDGNYSLTVIASKNHISRNGIRANAKRRGFPKPVGTYRNPQNSRLIQYYNEHEVLVWLGMIDPADDETKNQDTWDIPEHMPLAHADIAALLRNILAGVR